MQPRLPYPLQGLMVTEGPIIHKVSNQKGRTHERQQRFRQWLKLAKSIIISGRGGCRSVSRNRLGNLILTRHATTLLSS
jgi:hypothetical protein